jgi:N-glycosidase YbiA
VGPAIRFGGVVYPHVEHAYQAAKTLDRDVRLEFASPTLESWEAKKMGSELELRPDWEDIKLTVMEILVRQKFLNPEYLERLLLTKGYLEEGNYWHDQFWGNCTCKKHIAEPGQNHLGKILMQVRHELTNFEMTFTQKEAIEAREKYHC